MRRRVTGTELRDLPFGTLVEVHINIPGLCRDETYNGVIVQDKIYYEDGKFDFINIIANYIHNDDAEVFVI